MHTYAYENGYDYSPEAFGLNEAGKWQCHKNDDDHCKYGCKGDIFPINFVAKIYNPWKGVKYSMWSSSRNVEE